MYVNCAYCGHRETQMFGAELALAISLLVAPVGTPLPDLEGFDWLQLQSAIHRVAIDWEIMDPREKKFIVTSAAGLENDIDVLRRRYVLLDGAPMSVDASRFPATHIIQRHIEENRNLKSVIENRIHLDSDRASGFRLALIELDEIHHAWCTLQYAKSAWNYTHIRRAELKRLLGVLGREDYASAKMPPATPEWRFGHTYER